MHDEFTTLFTKYVGYYNYLFENCIIVYNNDLFLEILYILGYLKVILPPKHIAIVILGLFVIESLIVIGN